MQLFCEIQDNILSEIKFWCIFLSCVDFKLIYVTINGIATYPKFEYSLDVFVLDILLHFSMAFEFNHMFISAIMGHVGCISLIHNVEMFYQLPNLRSFVVSPWRIQVVGEIQIFPYPIVPVSGYQVDDKWNP